MRNIKTIGFTVLTGAVLAFGSPIAANAVPSTTPNKDALCAANGVPANLTSLNTQLAAATVVHDAAVAAMGVQDLAMVTVTGALSDAVLGYITALDGTDASATSIALNTLNVRSTGFATAASTWLAAHIAEVNAQNSVTGTTFLRNYVSQVGSKVCI